MRCRPVSGTTGGNWHSPFLVDGITVTFQGTGRQALQVIVGIVLRKPSRTDAPVERGALVKGVTIDAIEICKIQIGNKKHL